MKAAVLHGPRDLRIEETPDAVPASGQVRIRTAAGGICGSDLHYYLNGGFGTVRLREPMVLGHEVAGVGGAAGDGVHHLASGQPVAINPSRPCRACEYCLAGLPNHCTDMRFYGSAMRMPHVQGAFAEALVVDATQCVPVPDTVPLTHVAFAEPLSCALHAVGRAGPLLGRRVLVTGQGPIGALVTAAARLAGAEEIVATDVAATALTAARAMGADRAIDVAADPAAFEPYTRGKGYFHVAIEASGKAAAVEAALASLRPRGCMVALGLGGAVSLPMNVVTAKEIEIAGTFRFHEEFAQAAAHITSGRVDVRPLLSAVFPLANAVDAFELASDRSRAMKVQIAFDEAARGPAAASSRQRETR